MQQTLKSIAQQYKIDQQTVWYDKNKNDESYGGEPSMKKKETIKNDKK